MIHAKFPIEEIVQCLKQVKVDLLSGKYDKELVIAVQLAKSLYKYKKAFAPARATRILRKMGHYRPHQKIKFVYLSPGLVWPVGHGMPKRSITRAGYEHFWQNRTMTWLLKLLQPFISPTQLRLKLEDVRSLEYFLSNAELAQQCLLE